MYMVYTYTYTYIMAPVIIKLSKPRHRSKLAMFDFDWTLVKPKSGGTFPKDEDDWSWLQPMVPEKLKKYYEDGYAIIVFTNQSKSWKQAQIVKAMESLQIPCTIVIAFNKAEHKPNRIMFDSIVGDKKWDAKKSFFIGDALGRAADFADSDKKFAEALGVKVMPPEQIFPFAFKESENKTTINPLTSGQEVVIMVGYPGSGKSSLANAIFKGHQQYEVLDGDVSKTPAKMIATGKKLLATGKSVVFDATNPSTERRASYISLAKELNIPARCIHVKTSMEEAVARNNAREIAKGVPMIAYYLYRKKFEEPNPNEGCEVITV